MPSDSGPADDLLGQTLASQFRVIKRLGAGGMGAVYLAEQSDMGRQVVIKVMHPELTVGNPQAVERFKREARAVAALNHPHIVQVYVFGQADDGRMYLAMEFIQGRDLGGEITRAPIPQGRALKILDQVAAALVEAHSHGIVHRDLKPENIMLANRHGNPDWVKVLDFGIAKVGATGKDAPALTQQGAIFGTPRYMAPEQITGGVIDARTDLYALGVILHEMLTGEHPFKATSALDYLMKHVQEQVVLPNTAHPALGIDPKVEHILERLLAKKQEERFQSAAELQREVRVALGVIGEPLSHTLSISPAAIQEAIAESERAATVTHAPAPRARRPRRVWPWVALALLIVGGGTAAAVVALGGKGPATPEPIALLTPPPEPTTATSPDVASAPPDAQVSAEASAPIDSAAPADVQLARAGSSIEGFPVPEGTSLLTTEPLVLRLESTLPGQVLLEFYKVELAGRAKQVASGFEFTDPTSPWSYLFIANNGDRILLQVSRKAALAAHADDVIQIDAGADATAAADAIAETAAVATTPKPAPKVKPLPKPAPTTIATPTKPNPQRPPRTFRDKPGTTVTPAPNAPAKPPRTFRPR